MFIQSLFFDSGEGVYSSTIYLFLLRWAFFFPFGFFGLIFFDFFAAAPSSGFPLFLNLWSPFSCCFDLPANFDLKSRFWSPPSVDFFLNPLGLSSVFLRFASFVLFCAYFICFGTWARFRPPVLKWNNSVDFNELKIYLRNGNANCLPSSGSSPTSSR